MYHLYTPCIRNHIITSRFTLSVKAGTTRTRVVDSQSPKQSQAAAWGRGFLFDSVGFARKSCAQLLAVSRAYTHTSTHTRTHCRQPELAMKTCAHVPQLKICPQIAFNFIESVYFSAFFLAFFWMVFFPSSLALFIFRSVLFWLNLNLFFFLHRLPASSQGEQPFKAVMPPLGSAPLSQSQSQLALPAYFPFALAM